MKGINMKETKNVFISVYNSEKEKTEKIELTIKRSLTLTERSQLVTNAAEMIATKDEETNKFNYRPYVRQYAGRSQIIAMYTNLLEMYAVNNYTDFLWQIITETDLYDEITEFVGYDALDSVWYEIDDLVSFMVNEHNITSKHDQLLDALIDLLRAINNEIPSVDLENAEMELKKKITNKQ